MELLDGFNVEEGKEYIYLVMVEYKDKTLLKIGYSKTLEGRMDTYELHNPDIQLLKIREGTRGLEDYMHKKFEKYKYPKREEWFYYNEEIVEGFNTLEVKNFLDINKLKNKIHNLLKPKSVEKLRNLYYEKYEHEEKDLNLVISRVFSLLNKRIESFIDSLDYSEVPLELELESNIQFIIPDPIFLVNRVIGYKQLFGIQENQERNKKNITKITIKVVNNKSISEEFYDIFNLKKERSNGMLSTYIDTAGQLYKDLIVEVYKRLRDSDKYKEDYIDIITEDDKLIPIFNREIMESEERAFELQKEDYIARFNSL